MRRTAHRAGQPAVPGRGICCACAGTAGAGLLLLALALLVRACGSAV